MFEVLLIGEVLYVDFKEMGDDLVVPVGRGGGSEGEGQWV